MADEVSFPRGAPSTEESRSKKDKASRDSKDSKRTKERDEEEPQTKKDGSKRKKEANLFQTSSMDVDEHRGKSKKSKKSKSKSDEAQESDEERDDLKMTAAEAAALKGIAVEAPKYISLLRYTKVEERMQMLGAVREIHELSCLIALPNGMKGKLNLTEYSDSLTENITKKLASGEMDVDSDDDENDEKDSKNSSKRNAKGSNFSDKGSKNNSTLKTFPKSFFQIFKTGQIIRVTSLTANEEVSSSKQIELSTRESKLNEREDSSFFATLKQGQVISTSVKSIEDHGYIISTGIPNKTGFLPFTNVPKGKHFFPGQRLDLTISNISAASVITFKYEANMSSKLTTPEQVVAVDSLDAGMLVQAKVSKVLQDGLWMNFLGYFSGSVDIHHVAHPDSDAPLVFGDMQEMKKWFSEENTVLTARILHIHPETKRVALSLLPHIVSLTPVSFTGVTVGDRFENGEIRRVDEKGGLAMVISLDSKSQKSKEGEKQKKKTKSEDSDDEEESDSESSSEIPDLDEISQISDNSKFRAYVPLAKVSDTKKERVSESHYEIGSTKKVRVFGVNYLEGTLLLTHRKSDWKDPYLSYADIKVGDVVEGTIKSLNTKGAVVSLSSAVEAFCPRNHYSDVEVSDPEARFKIGSSIKARVLRVSVDAGNAIITFKKTLVKSTLAVVSSYDSEQFSGQWAHGTIISILDSGILVSFYNDVKGFAPLHELGIPGLESKKSGSKEANEAAADSARKTLRSMFKIGQVVKARVVESWPKTERMNLSFSSTVSATQTEKEQARDYVSSFKCGTTIKNLEVVKRDAEEGLVMTYEDKESGATLTVVVPLYHLSDHKELAKTKLDTFKIGQKIEKVLILARRRQSLVGTFKRSLIDAQDKNELPYDFESVSEGSVYCGYVTRFFDAGMLVRFGDNFCAFVAKAQLAPSTHHVSNIDKDFYIDQSVRAEIIKKDSSKMQAIASLKTPAALAASSSPSTDSSPSYLSSFLREQSALSKKKRDIDWEKFKIGNVVSAKVTKTESWGVLLEVPMGSSSSASSSSSAAAVGGNTGLSCFAHPAQVDGGPTNVKVGDTFSALILDINYQKGIVDVSLRSEIVKKFETSKTKAPSAGTTLDAIVQLVKKDYLVMTVKSGSGFAIVFGPARDFNSEGFIDPHTKYKTLTTLKSTIDAESFNGVQLAYLVPATTDSQAASQKKENLLGSNFQSSTISSLADIEVGKVLDGQVILIHQHRVEFALGARLKGFLDISQIDDISLPKKDCTVTALVASHPDRAPSKSSKKKSSSASSGAENLFEEISNLKLPTAHPFARFKVGDIIKDLKVHSIVECRSDGSFIEGLKKVPQNSSKDASASSKYQVLLTTRKTSSTPTVSTLSVGTIIPFWISQITSSSLNGFIAPNVRAYVSALESSYSPSIASSLSANFKVGQVVLGAVTEIEKESKKVHLSLRALHLEKSVASSVNDIKVGDTTMCKVAGFKMPFLRVQIFPKVFGRVFVTELSDTFVENPLDTWTSKEGQFLEARIVSISSSSGSEISGKSGEISSKSGEILPILSLRKSVVSSSSKKSKASNPRVTSYEDVESGMKLSGYISKHFEDKKFCFVALGDGVTGHLPYAVIGEKFTKDPAKKYPVGTLVTGTAMKVDVENKKIDFAMRERSEKDGPATDSTGAVLSVKYDNLKVGQLVKGVVGNVQSFGVFVKIAKSNISALCHVTALQDSTTAGKKSKHAKKEEAKEEGAKEEEERLTLEQIQALFKVGDNVTAVVTKKDDATKKVSLSMKASDILKAKKMKKDEKSENVDENKEENKEENKKNNKKSSKSMDISSSDSESQSSSSSSGESSSEEDEDEVMEKALQKKSLAKKRKATNELPSDSEDSSEEKESAMKIDDAKAKAKSDASAKNSKKRKTEEESDEEAEHISFHPQAADERSEDSEDSSDDSEDDGTSDSEHFGTSDSDDESEEEEEKNAKSGLSSAVQWDDLTFKSDKNKNDRDGANKKAREQWNMEVEGSEQGEDSSENSENSAESSQNETKTSSSKNGKKKAYKSEMEEEAAVSAKERALLKENLLESDADFERALMSAPNSSYFWARWIAQKVHDGNIKKAREIAERALQKIEDKEIEELFNVWVVFLNLERQFGTKESFSVLLRRAENSSKPKPIAMEAIKMLLKADRRNEAEEIYQRILRRYKHCMSSWVNWAIYHFEMSKFDLARDILNKSLKSLAPRKHINLLNKFAQLEYKYGNAERGRTIFETLLGNHPKRTDIWFVYIDMEIKHAQDIDRARQLYERTITLALNPTKMKPIFKRFLAFESAHGSSETLNHVKTKAAEYIASKTNE